MKTLFETINNSNKAYQELQSFINKNKNESWYKNIPSYKLRNPLNITYRYLPLYIEKDISGMVSISQGTKHITDYDKILFFLKLIKKAYEYFGSYNRIGYYDIRDLENK